MKLLSRRTVALTISTVYEGYQWTALAFAGLLLVLGGNLLAFMQFGAGRLAKATA